MAVNQIRPGQADAKNSCAFVGLTTWSIWQIDGKNREFLESVTSELIKGAAQWYCHISACLNTKGIGAECNLAILFQCGLEALCLGSVLETAEDVARQST